MSTIDWQAETSYQGNPKDINTLWQPYLLFLTGCQAVFIIGFPTAPSSPKIKLGRREYLKLLPSLGLDPTSSSTSMSRSRFQNLGPQTNYKILEQGNLLKQIKDKARLFNYFLCFRALSFIICFLRFPAGPRSEERSRGNISFEFLSSKLIRLPLEILPGQREPEQRLIFNL